MKRLLALLALVSLPAWGQPYLITNPVGNTVPTSTCTMFMDTVPGVTAPVALATAPLTGNICGPFNLASLAVGSHSVTVLASNPPDPLWGGGGPSPKSLPLAFVRPASSAPPQTPDGLRLIP